MARVRTRETVTAPIASAARFAPTPGAWPGRDGAALAILALLAALAVANRLVFDAWIARFDVYTFFVPWYAYLGAHLRAFDLPGWNPHLFSGTPFAGDPESGWMYLPAMLSFALFDVLNAFKAMLAVQIAIAGLTTYFLARTLGMGPAAALVAGVAYLAGPLLQWTSYCCFVLSGCAVWMPLAFLGVEMALRAGRWRDRIVPWFLTGFAVSQIFAGWVGEGWLVAPLAIGAWVAYRAILSPPRGGRTFAGRVLDAAATGAAGIGLGLALGAAGILIRLDVNAQSNLAGANYRGFGAEGILNPPWSGPHLLAQILGAGYDHRSAALGGAVVALALLAPVIAGRRFAVPFWVGLTLVAMAMTLPPGPLDHIFGLIPRFEELHSHDPWRVYTVAILGPALLAGATVESLPSWRGKPARALLAALPLAIIGVAAAVARPAEGFVGWPPLVAAALAMGAIALSVLATAVPGDWSRPLGRWLPLALALLIFIQPTGLELTGSWLGWPVDRSWEGQWHSDPIVMETLKREISPTDPGGAGDFLLARQAADGPFRYVGYGGILYPGDAARQASYMGRRFDPGVQAILVNGRPMLLGLDEIQGYDPIELARYDAFMRAVNGTAQNYHTAYLLPTGTGSRLLDLLDVRYALVDAALPQNRPDVVALANGGRKVFANDHVIVYERQPDARRAWIVHDVHAAKPGETLAPIASGAVDPFKTA
ncbi:MAG TPA: hypothetical protein VFQ80_14050, partial [Thermomicrobiales bacterium]|nr:hypothetical protein [Thermomicrobiales bacterium]